LVLTSRSELAGDSTNDEKPRRDPFRTLAMTMLSKGGRPSPKAARS
jgi:hypothetical protein